MNIDERYRAAEDEAQLESISSSGESASARKRTGARAIGWKPFGICGCSLICFLSSLRGDNNGDACTNQ